VRQVEEESIWGKRMKVTFTLNADDYWRVNRYVLFEKSRHIFFLIAFFLVLVAFGNLFPKNQPITFWSLIPMLLVVLIVGGIFLSLKFDILSLPFGKPSEAGEQILTLTQHRLTLQTATSDWSLSWDGVFDLAEDKKELFVFLSKNRALVVPKRAFSSEQECQAFFDSAKSYWKAVKATTHS
jgi:hypothetical protein